MKKSITAKLTAILLVAVLCLSACGSSDNSVNTEDKSQSSVSTGNDAQTQNQPAGTLASDTSDNSQSADGKAVENTNEGTTTDNTENVFENVGPKSAPSGDYIELALNVFYNDADHSYYKCENGSSIFVSEQGTYTLTFDCEQQLSDEAKAAGVNSLTNLTAVYIQDMGIAKAAQSPLKQANIKYDAVVVDGVSLTVTQNAPKSAFKSNGNFDTNDPINAWDGSQVEEVIAGEDHVANFTTVVNPTKVAVTFTLSDMVWTETVVENTFSDTAVDMNRNTSKFSDMDFTNMDAVTLTKYLGNGINLGNTMEAYGHSTLGVFAPVRSYETYWGQPATTAEMLKGMKACGFDTVRIPVSWTNMMAYEADDFTINPKYLDRVEEIVNYALDAEMFVIVNDHWDGGWWAMFGSSTPETVDKAYKLYTSMWEQIAERFKDYSDMLIFESANEELGDTLNNNADWFDSGKLTQDDCYRLTNDINQRFVDTIRKSGGNNDDRFLLIAGYNTDFDHTVDNRYKMPVDTVNGKLFLSVHYYTPWNYCGNEHDARWGLEQDYKLMNEQFAKLTKFTDAGYGIIIGEYGALPMYDSTTGIHTQKSNTVEFTNNLLDNCDLYNYCPVLWSCNDFFNRKKLNMISDELYELFVSRSYQEESAAGAGYLDAVNARMKANYEASPKMWDDVEEYVPGTPVAWIMWNGGAGTYSVGDVFNPADNTAGIKATNATIDGAGEYTVSLDFEGGNDGITFAALGLADGEVLYPNSIILIEDILLNGESANLIATPYTSSDDGKCMRVNLYNAWVSKAPDDARTLGSLKNASAVILDKNDLVGLKNITIKFRFIVR